MNGELLIVDEHTGRMLAGRRYSEGLHQALEAKERIEIKDENQTLATITLQNYFRLYKTKFIICAIGDIACISFATFRWCHIV